MPRTKEEIIIAQLLDGGVIIATSLKFKYLYDYFYNVHGGLYFKYYKNSGIIKKQDYQMILIRLKNNSNNIILSYYHNNDKDNLRDIRLSKHKPIES